MKLEIFGESQKPIEKVIALRLRHAGNAIELVMVDPYTSEQLHGGILLKIVSVYDKLQVKTMAYVNENHVLTVPTKDGLSQMTSVVEAE